MATTPPLHTGLHLRIAAVIRRTHTREDLHAVIAVCHALATAFVQSKQSSRTLIDRQGYSLADLGFDCIADLFQQDDRGDFIQLKSYFESLPSLESDAATLAHIRRLVFSKVNHRVFRIYNELDPGLGRILRNVKLAVQTLHTFTEVERYGELFLAPSLCETLEHLPPAEPETLLHDLLAEAPAQARIPELLSCLSRTLRRQTLSSRLVGLLDAAMIIRDWYAADHRIPAEGDQPDAVLARDDAMETIRRSCRTAFEALRETYVGKKQMCPELFATCCAVVEESVIDRLVRNGDRERSFFQRLRDRLPELTEDEYRSTHRTRLEYIARKAYSQAVGDLRREY